MKKIISILCFSFFGIFRLSSQTFGELKKVNYSKKLCIIALFLIGNGLFCSCSSNHRQITVQLSDTCSLEQQTAAYDIIIKRLASVGTIKDKSALSGGLFNVTCSFEEDTTISVIPLVTQKGEVYIADLPLNPTTVEKVTVEKETLYVPKGSCIYVLTIELKKEFHETFARLTAENIEKPLPLVVDGKIIASPAVRSAITDGKLSISGDLEPSEWYTLKSFIAGGVLPCEAKVIGGADKKKAVEGTTLLTENLAAEHPDWKVSNDTIVKKFIVRVRFQAKNYDIPFQLNWTAATDANGVSYVAFYQFDRMGGSDKVEIDTEASQFFTVANDPIVYCLTAGVKLVKAESIFDEHIFSIHFTADSIDSTEGNIYEINQ